MRTVAYEEQYGQVVFPEGFEETIKGLPVKEQMAHYRTTTSYKICNIGWRERFWQSSYRRIEENPDVQAVIVKDGMMVGIMIVGDNGRVVSCLPEQRVCTYYASDNNGAGYKTREEYTYLVCVPGDFGA